MIYKFNILDFSWGGFVLLSFVFILLIKGLFFSRQTKTMPIVMKITILSIYTLIFLSPFIIGIKAQLGGYFALKNTSYEVMEGEIMNIGGDTRLQIVKLEKGMFYNNSAKTFCYTAPSLVNAGVEVGDKISVKYVGEPKDKNGKGICILEISKL